MNLADKLEYIAGELLQYADALRDGYLIEITDIYETERKLHKIIHHEEQ